MRTTQQHPGPQDARPRGSCPAGLSVIVATRDRAPALARLLRSLEPEWPAIGEAIVVDNGSRDRTPELLRECCAAQPGLRALHCSAPGKARALNVALARADGALLAFLDDDVVVRPGWASALVRAAATSASPAFQGQILPPADVLRDPIRLARWKLYGTLPVVSEVRPERFALTGANMAIRREVLERTGGFDERLGPGASGLCEDTDLALRIVAAFGPCAYVPDATVEHEWDAERLTPEYFRAYHRRLGRSRWIQKHNSLFLSILPNLARAGVLRALTSWYGEDRRHYRYIARYVRYREMLRSRMGRVEE